MKHQILYTAVGLGVFIVALALKLWLQDLLRPKGRDTRRP